MHARVIRRIVLSSKRLHMNPFTLVVLSDGMFSIISKLKGMFGSSLPRRHRVGFKQDTSGLRAGWLVRREWLRVGYGEVQVRKSRSIGPVA